MQHTASTRRDVGPARAHARRADLRFRNVQMDVFNALNVMENDQFLKDLKFGIGAGTPYYRLYNWKCARCACGGGWCCSGFAVRRAAAGVGRCYVCHVGSKPHGPERAWTRCVTLLPREAGRGAAAASMALGPAVRVRASKSVQINSGFQRASRRERRAYGLVPRAAAIAEAAHLSARRSALQKFARAPQVRAQRIKQSRRTNTKRANAAGRRAAPPLN